MGSFIVKNQKDPETNLTLRQRPADGSLCHCLGSLRYFHNETGICPPYASGSRTIDRRMHYSSQHLLPSRRVPPFRDFTLLHIQQACHFISQRTASRYTGLFNLLLWRSNLLPPFGNVKHQ